MDISVALGGGGIKGVAHVGVLECLEDAGFKIRAVAGTSAGGLLGSIYAAGVSPKEILAIVNRMDQQHMYQRHAKDGPSLLGYAGLTNMLVEVLGDCTFHDMKTPFACTAVDTRTSREIYLNEGRVVDAVLATIAVPGIFPPKMRGDMELIDGSVLDPVPVHLARCLAPNLPVVAVALNPERERWNQLPEFNITSPVPLPIPSPIIDGIARMRIAQAFRIFVHSMDISSRMLTELRLEVDQPEVIIRPDVHQYGLLDAVVPEKLILEGYRAAENAIPEIHKALSWKRSMMRFWKQSASAWNGKRDENRPHIPPPEPEE